MSRPTVFTQQLADDICNRIAVGESLHRICMDADMPSRSTVLLWLRTGKQKEFLNQYMDAKGAQADYLAEQILEIADECDGAKRSSEVQAAKLRIEARKWYAGITAPKKYNDRFLLERAATQNSNAEMTIEEAHSILIRYGLDPAKL